MQIYSICHITIYYCKGFFDSLTCKFTLRAPELQQCDETDEDYQKRKLSYIPRTAENEAYCAFQAIDVGRCKTLHNGICPKGTINRRLYDLYCVYENENAEDKINNLPALSIEQYFDLRDGQWLTRTEYCNRLDQQHIKLKVYIKIHNEYCSDKPLKNNLK